MRKAVGTLGVLLCLTMTGCGVMRDAKQAFDDDVNGFKQDFARVFLKKETNDYKMD